MLLTSPAQVPSCLEPPPKHLNTMETPKAEIVNYSSQLSQDVNFIYDMARPSRWFSASNIIFSLGRPHVPGIPISGLGMSCKLS